MRTLAIECASEACSAALFDGGELIAGDFRVLGRGHAEALIPMIAQLPGNGRADRIAVSLGPGSFTGVRVGLAAARALALAWKAQVTGYPTLALVAAMARARSGQEAVSVAMSGGHGEWFVQDFAPGSITGDPASLRPEDAAHMASHHLVAGNQAETLVAARGTGTAQQLWPDARAFALLPESALLGDAGPIYGRAPDAKLPQVP